MTILIVDDSRAMRTIIKRTFREMDLGDATYLEASNGREALATVLESEPELIISDYNMPEMNGLEFLGALQQSNSKSRLGFVTSEANAEFRSKAQEIGAAFVITKPFTAADLCKSIDPVLRTWGIRVSGADQQPQARTTVTTNGLCQPNQAATILASIITRKEVEVKPAPPMPLPPSTAHVVAEYLEDNKICACAICDISFAAYAGSAVMMIPPYAAIEAAKTRVLEPNMWDDLLEVFNVTSRMFGRSDQSALRLGRAYRPGETRSPELTTLLKTPSRRLDLRVTIDTYGDGLLTLATFN